MNTQPTCDKCGRFINPNGNGVSWSQSYTNYDLHDPTYRCSRCTDKHGIAKSNCNPLTGRWEGRNLADGGIKTRMREAPAPSSTVEITASIPDTKKDSLKSLNGLLSLGTYK